MLSYTYKVFLGVWWWSDRWAGRAYPLINRSLGMFWSERGPSPHLGTSRATGRTSLKRPHFSYSSSSSSNISVHHHDKVPIITHQISIKSHNFKRQASPFPSAQRSPHEPRFQIRQRKQWQLHYHHRQRSAANNIHDKSSLCHVKLSGHMHNQIPHKYNNAHRHSQPSTLHTVTQSSSAISSGVRHLP